MLSAELFGGEIGKKVTGDFFSPVLHQTTSYSSCTVSAGGDAAVAGNAASAQTHAEGIRSGTARAAVAPALRRYLGMFYGLPTPLA